MKRIVACLAVVVAVPACAQGKSVVSSARSGTIDVAMRGSHFFPDSVTVSQGKSVTFRFTNDDKIAHEAFIGDQKAQQSHEDEMRMNRAKDHGDMTMNEADAVTVQPGKTRELTSTFNMNGTTLIGCHEPGHYDGGMVMKVTVR